MSDPILDKIRKLLALAERAGTEAEAASASEAAERLIAKYAVDIALLQDARGDKGKPLSKRVPLDGSYEKPRALLLQVIAEAYGCRSIWHGTGYSTVVGFESDIETVELLFASLTLQATNAALREGHGQQRVRAFRNAFLLSFANRVGQRLREIRKQTVEEAGSGAEIVLRDRSKDVQQAYAEAFPNRTVTRSSMSSSAGSTVEPQQVVDWLRECCNALPDVETRSFGVGLPATVTVNGDGSITVEVDLSEVDEIEDIELDDAQHDLYAAHIRNALLHERVEVS